MKPTWKYEFSLKSGTKSTYELKAWDGPFEYPPFHVPAKRSGISTLRVNEDFTGRSRRGTLHLGNPESSHLTGLYPQDPEHPTCYLGGSPDQDKDTWLVQVNADRLTVLVFPDTFMERLAFFGLWIDGDLENVEAPK